MRLFRNIRYEQLYQVLLIHVSLSFDYVFSAPLKHNSYERKESIMDQLQYHLIRSLELDIWDSKPGHSDVEGDWFVYHLPLLDTETTCNLLSECLQEFRAWSD